MSVPARAVAMPDVPHAERAEWLVFLRRLAARRTALIGLIVFGIVLIFVQIPNGALIYSVLGLVIFAGLTMFDFQRLRRTRDIRTAPLLAASIFLDVLNVFLFFLSIFSNE